MKKELEKRVVTSFILFLLLIFCIFVSRSIYIMSILVICGIAIKEIFYLISTIEKNTYCSLQPEISGYVCLCSCILDGKKYYIHEKD